MNVNVVTCPSCRNALPKAICNTGEMAFCPSCDTSVQVEVFPAFFQSTLTGAKAETIVETGTSSCFYHENKKAVIHCDTCGRFLCALCDLDIGGAHICPACAEAGRKKGNVAELETNRVMYDSAALVLAIGAFLIWPIAVITAPTAIVLAVLSWRRPGSLVPRTRLRSYIAILVAILQLIGIAGFFIILSNEG